MSWYTTCKGEMLWSRKTYNHQSQVYDDIEDNKQTIERCKNLIYMLTAGNIRDVLECKDCEGYEMDPAVVAQNRLQEIFEEMEEAIIDNYKLNFLLENWDTRDGDFVKNPLIPKEPEPDPNQLEMIFDPKLQKLRDSLDENWKKVKPIL